MRKNGQKKLSLVLALVMALTLLPTAAFAAGQTYRPQTGAELEALLSYDSMGTVASGSTIYLEAKPYQVNEGLWIEDVDDLSIIGQPGTKIVLDNGLDTVMSFISCENLTLRSLIVGHNEYLSDFAGCSAGVLYFYSSDARMTDCELFGCGLEGFEAFDSTLTMERCTIRDCSSYAARIWFTSVDMKGCLISGNGYSEKMRREAAFMIAEDLDSTKEFTVNFTNCTFTNNQNKAFWAREDDWDPHVKVNTVNCTFSGNGWGNTQQPARELAYASTQTVTVDGKPVEFQMYALKDANGSDTNYIKLRDMAYVLNGTKAQFSVDWDGSISLTAGAAYKANGSEMSTPFSGDRAYKGGAQTLKVNGKDVTLDALVLTDDAGSGYTYFKLRDLGSALGFKVDWNAQKGVTVETGGTAQAPAQPEDNSLTAEVVRLVNAERAKEGLAPLETFDALTQAAAIRAPELAVNFSHTRPDGSDCFTALDETGANRGAYTYGENIAIGAPTAAIVVEGWMNSPGHRANILNPDFTHIGVGYFNAPGGYQHCWVQMFVGK